MTDDDLIAQAVADCRCDGNASFETAAHLMELELELHVDLRRAVARHLLSRDPECVRVPMVGIVK